MASGKMCSPWFVLILVHLVGAITDSPRVFHPTERKEMSDFEVPQGLIGAEREILHLGPRKKTNHEEAEESHPVTYTIPFDKEHFIFENDDWDVFTLPNSRGEQMIVSNPSNITKTVTILTTIRNNLDAVLRYQIHLTSGKAPVSPSLLGFLVDNGTRVLLKEEFPEEVWRNSSIHLRTVGESQLLFVGVLHDERNKIVLRSLTLEIAPFYTEQYGEETSYTSEGDHFLTAGESPENSKGVNHSSAHDQGSQLENDNVPPEVDYDNFTSDNISSHENTSSVSVQDINESNSNAASDIAEDSSVNDTNANSEDAGHDEPDMDSTTDQLEMPDDVDANDTYQYSSNVSESSNSLNETSEATESSNDTYENELESEFSNHSNNESGASPSNPVHLSSGDKPSSDASGVFTFFIVIMVVSFIILGVLWWRRRKGREDDEIPVFSRNATEHGNPTFAETEENTEVGLNTETPSNYRSFR